MIFTCTVEKALARRFGPALVFLAMLGPPALRTADAHPVSQGALEIDVFPDRVTVTATVSTEEVLVAASGRGGSLSDPMAGHGAYLLDHLHINADGRPLAGRVAGAPGRVKGRPSYRLEYRFPGARPSRLVVHEDVLREISFAPGTPWEASYLVRIGHHDGPGADAVLLTCRDPLTFACRWRNDDPGAGAPRPGVSTGRLHLGTFVRHGVLHILTGYDHLLFVAALLLAAEGLWDLIKVVMTFTLAHTITLAASALDVVRLPGAIVEPMIAASIVVVAAQNVCWPGRSRGRARLLTTFGFGLFHGLGFAGGLLDAMSGLDSAGTLLAIAAFSVGVELGHQVIVLPGLGMLWVLRRAGPDTSSRDRLVRQYGSAAVTGFGLFYLVHSFL